MYESYLSWVEFVLSFQAASSKDLWLRIVLSIHVAALPKIGKYDWFIFCFTFDPNITHTRAHTRTHKDITLIFLNIFFTELWHYVLGYFIKGIYSYHQCSCCWKGFFHTITWFWAHWNLWQIDSTLKNKGYNGWFITACLLNFQSSCILFHAHWGSY